MAGVGIVLLKVLRRVLDHLGRSSTQRRRRQAWEATREQEPARHATG